MLGAPVTTDTVAVARTSGAIFQPWQLWWFLGEHGHRVMGLTGEKVGYRTPPAWVSTVNHPLVVLVPIASALLVTRRRGTLRAADGFALLALCFQLRCLLDTWNNVYYALPACLALVAWEVHAGRLPLVAFATTGMTWITFELLPDVAGPDLQAAAYLAFALPLVGALALVERSGDDLQLLRQRRDDLGAVVGDDHEVLDPHAHGARDVDPGLDRDDHAGGQRGLALLGQPRPLVDVEAHAVARGRGRSARRGRRRR